MTTCAFLEWPEALHPAGAAWGALRRQVEAMQPDLLITNEMPFGDWLPSASKFDRAAAARWVEQHRLGLEAHAA